MKSVLMWAKAVLLWAYAAAVLPLISPLLSRESRMFRNSPHNPVAGNGICKIIAVVFATLLQGCEQLTITLPASLCCSVGSCVLGCVVWRTNVCTYRCTLRPLPVNFWLGISCLRPIKTNRQCLAQNPWLPDRTKRMYALYELSLEIHASIHLRERCFFLLGSQL